MGNKVIAMLSGIIGISAAVLSLIFPVLLAWWQATITNSFLGFIDGSTYVNAFGYMTNTYNTDVSSLGNMFLIAGLVFLAGSILIIITAAKESKIGSIVCALLMIGGIFLFAYALNVEQDLIDYLAALGVWTGQDYNIYFGSAQIIVAGKWTWRLGNGYIIAAIASVLGLIGSFFVEK